LLSKGDLLEGGKRAIATKRNKKRRINRRSGMGAGYQKGIEKQKNLSLMRTSLRAMSATLGACREKKN